MFSELNINVRRGSVAWLIDPDRLDCALLERLVRERHLPGAILLGGSVVHADPGAALRAVLDCLRPLAGEACRPPVLLFPGDPTQLAAGADAALLLSLVSGRNAELLIGRHVVAAPIMRRLGLRPLPTAYLLVDGGARTTVEYVSGTMPLPCDKPDLAADTALAAEMLGMRLTYLEGGSGAPVGVPSAVIRAVRAATSIPLAVGGGLTRREQIEAAFAAGADLAVVGTAIERNPLSAFELW